MHALTDRIGRRATLTAGMLANAAALLTAGYLVAPVAGTRLLAAGRPALWLTCAALCAVAAVGQLAIGPAIRRRSRPA